MSHALVSSLDVFSPGEHQAIRDRIVEIMKALTESQRQREPCFTTNADFFYNPRPLNADPDRTNEMCCKLYEVAAIAAGTEGKLEAMDEITSSLFEHWFVPWGSWIPSAQALSDAACKLILRLPSQLMRFHSGRRLSSVVAMEYVSHNVSRMALRICILLDRPLQSGRRGEPYWGMAAVTEDIALLLSAAERLSETRLQDSEAAWSLVKSFLWTELQRLLMLWNWSISHIMIREGYNSELILKHRMQQDRIRPVVLSQITRHEEDVVRLRPDYMCPWMFSSLRKDGSSICMDFRRVLAL